MSDSTPKKTKLSESVNSQITDSLAPANSPLPQNEVTQAPANIFMLITQALSNAANNAVNAQQQSYTTMLAATTMGVEAIYTIDKPATEAGAQQILQCRAELEEAMKSFIITPSAAMLGATDNASLSEDFATGISSIMHGFTVSLDHLGESAYLQMLRIIQLAAVASTLAALIKSPEQFESYERVLALIKNLR